MSSLSVANTKFTLDLFRQLRKDGDNVFYSPVSILSALAMLDLGARGNTALQMEKVLHFNEITEKATKKPTAPHAGESGIVHHEIQKFLTELNKPSDAYNLKIANRVYGEKEFQFLQEYLDGIKKFYLATVESLDFKNAPEESRKKINSWVESQTNEKIKDLFPSGSIDQTTRLVLVNAVYFKGRWDKEFKKELTTEAKFWQNKNVSKSVQMMAKSGHFNFAFLEDVQAKILEIPYKGNHLSMVLLLPNEADGLQELEDKLTAEKLMEWTSPESMEMTNVNVCLPRFKVEETYDLVTILRAMGMEDVFCPKKADLSCMTGTQGLSVSKVVHKSFVEVNEEGTEAAAATGVVVKPTSAPMPPVSFYCDHPFLFFIKQNKTHSILFFGRVSSP
ncbi:serpin B4-like [Marmota flaviventris]|uniref:serpin B4-like n=1 Tax=Marmota flaviventris TaxID=93162 RepID=UPI003A8C4D8C